MPRIPIIPPRDVGAGGTGGGPRPEALPPEQADALRALEARTARIDRELAVAQSWRAAVDRLAEAEDAEDGPPPGFTRCFLDDADKERAALLKTLPAGRQSDLEDDLLSLRSVLADRAAQAEASGLAERRRSGLYRTLDEYRQGVSRDPGLYDEAVLRLDGLSGDLGLPDDRLTAMRHELRDALGNAAVDGLMANPERTVRVLSDGLFDDALSDASKPRRLSEAQTAAAKTKLHTREQAVSGLATQARQGTAPDEAILAAEKDGALGAAEAARLRDANAKAAERAAIRDARIQRVTTLTEPLDPSNPEDQAAASDYWDSVAEVYASDDAEEQRDKEFAFVERMGVLPDGLSHKYQGALLSTDPALVVSGATALSDLQKMKPTLVSGIRPEWMRMATAIADFRILDLPPERAIELAEQEHAREDTSAGTGAELQTGAVEPVFEEDGAPDVDASSRPADGVDQTDGPFDFGDEQEAESDGTAEVEPSEDALEEIGAERGETEEGPERNGFEEPFREGPDWSEVEALQAVLTSQGVAAFVTAAEEAGLNPTVARLFVDLLQATPEDQSAIFGRIDQEYGQGYGVFLKPLIADRVLQTEDQEERKALLEPHLWQSRSDAALKLGIGAVLGGGMFGPGVGRGKGNRRNKPQSRGPTRQPGPARRGDFAPGPAGQREWNEMQQRIRAGLPKGFKSLEDVRGLASTFEKQMAASGNPRARLAIRGSAVTSRSFEEETGKYTGHRFDKGEKESDFDFAIVDGALFNKAIRAGVGVAPAGTRTIELRDRDLGKLGLVSMAMSVGRFAEGRRHSFVIYGSEKAIKDRGPLIWISGGIGR